MKCDNCKNNEATFFYQETVNGKTRSLHLCPDCAAKMQGGEKLFSDDPFPALSAMKGSLLNGLFGLSTRAEQESKRVCPDCGATLQDLRRAGKALCPKCYTAFGEELAPTLRSLHGNVTHTGRAPADCREKREKEDRLSQLKRELAEAVAEEKFEDAAKLRDEIRTLEKE